MHLVWCTWPPREGGPLPARSESSRTRYGSTPRDRIRYSLDGGERCSVEAVGAVREVIKAGWFWASAAAGMVGATWYPLP